MTSLECSRCGKLRTNSYGIGTQVGLCRDCFDELRKQPKGKSHKRSVWEQILGIFQ